MKTRMYEGNVMSELMGQIRTELGEEAYILRSDERSDGSFLLEVGVGEELVETYSDHQQVSVTKTLTEQIHYDARLPLTSRVVALVGPTGVGKTTTIAKLAARLSESCQIRIGLISLDSYRVGAGYQLHTYANLLGLPCKVIHPKRPVIEEYKKAMHALRLCDLIFVDCAGCSPRDRARLRQMQQTFDELGDIEKLLVLAAPTNEKDLLQHTLAFSQVGYSRVILTKLDETSFLEPAVQSVVKQQRPLAFLTTGQRVPEDIEPATSARLDWMLNQKVH